MESQGILVLQVSVFLFVLLFVAMLAFCHWCKQIKKKTNVKNKFQSQQNKGGVWSRCRGGGADLKNLTFLCFAGNLDPWKSSVQWSVKSGKVREFDFVK